MKIDFIKNTKRNVLWGFINKAVMILFPFLIRTITLEVLGDKYLGLNGLFTSVLQVLNLTELGLSSAIVYSMYEPIAKNNEEQICALLRLFRKAYYVIAGLILAAGLLIIPWLPLFIEDDVSTIGVNIYAVYLIYLFNTVASYCFFGYRTVILTAFQRTDVSSNVSTVIQIAAYTAQILLIIGTKNYYAYLIVLPISTILVNVLNYIISKKMFPQYVCVGRVDSKILEGMKKQLVGLMVNKLCQTSRNSLDQICISAFLGLTMTTIYGNYYYILTAVVTFIGILTTSMLSGIGNNIVLKSVEENYRDFKKINFVYMWIGGWCTICMAVLYQPFMELWVGSDLLLDFGVVICLVVYFYVHCMNVFLNSYKDAAGMWHEDRFRPLVEAFANLSLNIVLVQYIGLYGVVLSTILSMLLVAPWLVHNLFSLILEKRYLGQFVRRMVYYVLVALIAAGVTYGVCCLVVISPAGTFAVRMVLCAFIPNLVIWAMMRHVPEFDDCLSLVVQVSGGKLGWLVALARRGARRR